MVCVGGHEAYAHAADIGTGQASPRSTDSDRLIEAWWTLPTFSSSTTADTDICLASWSAPCAKRRSHKEKYRCPFTLLQPQPCCYRVHMLRLIRLVCHRRRVVLQQLRDTAEHRDAIDNSTTSDRSDDRVCCMNR